MLQSIIHFLFLYIYFALHLCSGCDTVYCIIFGTERVNCVSVTSLVFICLPLMEAHAYIGIAASWPLRVWEVKEKDLLWCHLLWHLPVCGLSIMDLITLRCGLYLSLKFNGICTAKEVYFVSANYGISLWSYVMYQDVLNVKYLCWTCQFPGLRLL